MKEPDTQYALLISDTRGKRKFPLGGAKYTIGRESDNTIQIYSRFVSKHHAALLRIPSSESGRYIYRILDGDTSGKPSTNGVTINHHNKVNSYDLQHGDTVILAPDVELKYLVLSQGTLEEDEWIGFESLRGFKDEPAIKVPPTEISSTDH